MEEIHILPTNKTPDIILNPGGIISIKGRAIDETRINDPEQILQWIDAYLLEPPDLTDVTVALEFLNSFNTIIFTSILKRISLLTQQGKKLQIKWYYEEDDVDLFERGEYIATIINFPIQFIAVSDIADF